MLTGIVTTLVRRDKARRWRRLYQTQTNERNWPVRMRAQDLGLLAWHSMCVIENR